MALKQNNIFVQNIVLHENLQHIYNDIHCMYRQIIKSLLLIFRLKSVVLSIFLAILFFQSDRARDTGVYTIKLTCEAGTFEAAAKVNVLDVPLKPRNLTPDEVRAEHVKLSWQPPEDDGGTPITSYLVR